jgi:hypothetical protein
MDISKAVSRVYEGMLAAVMKLTGRKNGTSNLKVRILLEDEKVMSIVVRVSEKKIKWSKRLGLMVKIETQPSV